MSARALGVWTALAALAADQGHKLWMLNIFDIRSRQPLHLGPFLDIVLVWNPGISYSLLRADTPAGRWALVAFAVAAISGLGWLMWRASNYWLGLGFGLIVGGAIGNLIDRIAYGAVADFFHLYIDTVRWGRLSWYVFNIADVAIVAGVALLMYEAFFVAGRTATKSPESGGKSEA
ncbi:MAG: signal peptidase II [Beijerinckiaceae bacterium]